MEPTSATIPILRIQQLPAYQTGGQPQQSPFTQGQFLQGLISAKGGNNQFTIDIGGQQIQAESSASLQVGQKLDLQVAALAPRVELRILSNPVNRLIGTSIHLIGQQAPLLSELANLAEKSALLPQLSNEAKGTLQLYARGLDFRQSPEPATSMPFRGLLGQLAGATLSALQTSDTMTPAFRETVAGLLQQLAQSPSFPAPMAARMSQLAQDFGNQASAQAGSATPEQTMLLAPQSLALLTGLAAKQETLLPQNPLANLLLGQQGAQGLPVPPGLQGLVTLLDDLSGQLSSPPSSPQRLEIDGAQVQQRIDRLGMNLEQLLAEGRSQEAVQTLKYALLELAQHLPTDDKGGTQAEQLTKSIELYQLLQIRLAGEALLFLPLPFSFLDQGYLVVDRDQHGDGQEKTGAATTTYELHLQLEGLGNLQINMRKEEERLALTFYAQDAERAGFLAGFREELDRWLTSADVHSMQFLVGAKEPTKTLLEKIVHGISGMVDTRA